MSKRCRRSRSICAAIIAAISGTRKRLTARIVAGVSGIARIARWLGRAVRWHWRRLLKIFLPLASLIAILEQFVDIVWPVLEVAERVIAVLCFWGE